MGEVRIQSKKTNLILQNPQAGGHTKVSLPYSPSQMDRVRLSPCKPNKDTPAQGSGRGPGRAPQGQAIMYAYNNKNGKRVSHRSRLNMDSKINPYGYILTPRTVSKYLCVVSSYLVR